MTDKNPNQTSTSTNKIGETFEPLKELVLQDTKGLSYCRRNFIDACITCAKDLRLEGIKPENKDPREVVNQYRIEYKAIRNHLCDWILLEGGTDEEAFSEAVFDVLEKIMTLNQHEGDGEDIRLKCCSCFAYETFLYIIASLLKSESYETLYMIYNSYYLLLPLDTSNNNDVSQKMFDGFQGKDIETKAIQESIDRKDILLADIQQADLLSSLISCIKPDTIWYPATLHLPGARTSHPFFVRAVQHKNFLKLATIAGVSISELKNKVKEGKPKNLKSYCQKIGRSFEELVNMDAWDTME